MVCSSQSRFPRRLCSVFFFLLCLSFSSCGALLPVSAQTWSATSSSWHDPDFKGNPRTLIILIWISIWLPFWIIGSVLLWRRRTHFPIAGRGSNYLIAILANCFLGFYIFGIVGIGWPQGPPCSVLFIFDMCSTFVLAMTYTIRGWILVFRLEIQQFLTESRWREERRAMREKHAKKIHKEHSSIVGSNPENAVVSVTVQEPESNDVTSMPGYFFIRNRYCIEAKFMWKFLAAAGVLCIISMTLIAIFDPDVALTDHVLQSRGDLAEGATTGSQFSSSSAFFSAPPCLVYSTKLMVFFFLFSVIAVSVILWIVWRIIIDKQRTSKRKAEQQALHMELFATDAPAPTTAQAAQGGINLDDVEAVKREMTFAMFSALLGTAEYFLIQPFDPGFNTYLQLSIYPLLLVWSILVPLRQSYAVSAKTKALIDHSRQSMKDTNKIDVHHRLPHQKPFFSLKFILKNPATYPVLLKFLQQEWSSENALFWTESKEFEKTALELEVKIPAWPSQQRDDEHDHETTGITSTTKQMRHKNNQAQHSPHHQPQQASVDIVTPLAPSHQRSSSLSTQNKVPSLNSSPIAAPSALSTTATQPILQFPSTSHSSGSGNGNSSNGNSHSEDQPPTSAVELVPMQASIVQFKQLHIEAQQLKAWALQICTNYLARSSMYEINIAEDLNKMVQAQVKTLHNWEPTPGYHTGGGSASTAGNSAYATSPASVHPCPITDSSSGSGEGSSKPGRGEVDLAGLSALLEQQLSELTYPAPPPFALSSLYRATNLAVYELIQRDSFRRFVLTTSFAELLARADEEELHRVEKQQDLAHEGKEAEQALSQALAKLQSVGSPSHKASSIPQSPSKGLNSQSMLMRTITSQVRTSVNAATAATAIDGEVNVNLPGTPLMSPTTVAVAHSTPTVASRDRSGSFGSPTFLPMLPPPIPQSPGALPATQPDTPVVFEEEDGAEEDDRDSEGSLGVSSPTVRPARPRLSSHSMNPLRQSTTIE